MKKWLQRIFGLFILILYCISVLAQEITVSGRITGPGNEPLQGVNVNVKFTSRYVTTDTGGFYVIKAQKGQVLIFTSAGIQKKEILVAMILSLIFQ